MTHECGGCSAAREARARARAEVVAARSGAPYQAVAAGASMQYEVTFADGSKGPRKFTTRQAAVLFVGKRSATITAVR